MIIMTACSEPAEKPLSRKFVREIDSLVTIYNEAHVAEYDSICQILQDSLTNHYFDSILSKKMLELERLNK
jgi:hypothetical protein